MFTGAEGRLGKERSPPQGQSLCEMLHSLGQACVSPQLPQETSLFLFHKKAVKLRAVEPLARDQKAGHSQAVWNSELPDT